LDAATPADGQSLADLMPDQPARPLRLGVTAEGAMYRPEAQYRLLEVARAADQAGVDYIDTSEHVLMGRGALLAGQGWEPTHLDMPQPESLVTLAAMAGATQRIRRVEHRDRAAASGRPGGQDGRHAARHLARP
jgi:hypothetical protein